MSAVPVGQGGAPLFADEALFQEAREGLTPCALNIFRIVTFVAVCTLTSMAAVGTMPHFEYSISLISLGGVRMLSQLADLKRSKAAVACGGLWDAALVLIGILGMNGALTLGETIWGSIIWGFAPIALLAVIIVIALIATIILCSCARGGMGSSFQAPTVDEMMRDDFDIFNWGVRAHNADLRAKRAKENAKEIKAGKEFIDFYVKAALPTAEEQRLFSEADASMMEFAYRKVIYEYVFGELKDETTLPIFIESGAAKSIQTLRRENVAAVPEQLSNRYNNYAVYAEETNLTEQIAVRLDGHIRDTAANWHKDKLFMEAYAAANTPTEDTV